MDICIKNGKIVESVNEHKAKKIDATGLTVMPGAWTFILTLQAAKSTLAEWFDRKTTLKTL